MHENIRFGGVPEHFNIPIYYGIQQNRFAQSGLNFSWTAYPGGTGAILNDLEDGKLDAATILSEGAIARILQGANLKIIKIYVDSPLVWGVHTKAGAGLDMGALQGKKYAISRFQSGSHLMPKVLARYYDYQIADPDDYVVVKDLNGAREALLHDRADIFLWEKFITQPYVDKGEFERIGECPTPWPPFLVVVRNELLESTYPQWQLFFQQLHTLIHELIRSGSIIQMVADEFGLQRFDAVRWYAEVEWNTDKYLNTERISSMLAQLSESGLIEPPDDLDACIRKLVYVPSI